VLLMAPEGKTQDFKEIELLCRSSIEIYKRRIIQTNQEDPFMKIVVQGQLSRDYSKMSGTMSILGLAHELEGRLMDSLRLQKEALKSRRFGCEDDLTTAWILERLCRVYHKAGLAAEESSTIEELVDLCDSLEEGRQEKQAIYDDLRAVLGQAKANKHVHDRLPSG